MRLFNVAGDFFLILHLPVQDRDIMSFTQPFTPGVLGSGFFLVLLGWL